MKTTNSPTLTSNPRHLGWMAMMGLALASLSACHSNDTYTGGGGVYQKPWYDVYGYVCGYGVPQAGCNFYADGSKITAAEDPNYSPSAFQNGMSYGLWTYIDSYGYAAAYTGWAWLSPTGILYDDYGYALNEDQEQDGRDVIAQASAKETALVAKAGKNLASRFALAEATGVSIARTLNQMATLPKRLSRARNDADIADFTKRLYGVDLSRAMAAAGKAASGDLVELQAVNADVAAHWGTQPETSEAILRSWYKDLATEL